MYGTAKGLQCSTPNWRNPQSCGCHRCTESSRNTGTYGFFIRDSAATIGGLSHFSAGVRYMPDSLSDSALMLRFQQDGDFDAFGELFGRHKDAFVAYLTHLSGSAAIAEDVSQHCWLKLIESVGEGRYRSIAGASFRSYLYTLGRNRYIDEYQRKHDEARRGAMPDLDLVEHPATSPGDDAEVGQQAAMLGKALAELPLEQRDVIALWSAGVTIEHMVEITAAPRDTVLSRKKYALAKLRNAFAGMGVTSYDD